LAPRVSCLTVAASRRSFLSYPLVRSVCAGFATSLIPAILILHELIAAHTELPSALYAQVIHYLSSPFIGEA
jgi:hypothetical protein